MTWELLHRGRWNIILGPLGAIAFPTLVLAALRHDGALDPNDKSMLIMHIVMVMLMGLTCGSQFVSPFVGTRSKVGNLYAYPLRSSEIVTWKLIPATAILSLQMVVCIATINWLFNLDWPIWGPALWVATTFVAIQAALWLAESSPGWLAIAMAIVGAILGLWFKSRYGKTFSDPTHYWEHLRAVEVFTMAALAAIAYWVAVLGVARNRRGEPPFSIGLVEWLNRIFETGSSLNAQLTTPFEAQCWCEWQRKGWVMPFAALVLIVLGLVMWLFAIRDAEALFIAFLLGGGMLWLLGFIGGILFGNAGPRDDKYEMGHFLATRPISNSDLSQAILRTAAKSIVTTWLIWAASFLIVSGLIWLFGAGSKLTIPPEFNWLYFAGTLFGPWIVAGIFMSLGLMGRPKIIVLLACIVPGVVIVTTIIAKFFLTPEAQTVLSQAVAFMGTAALVIVAIWVFIKANQRGLIQPRTLWTAAAVWAVTTLGLALAWPLEAKPYLLGYSLVAALVALTIVPIAAVPLALSWNRHR
jgi:hypothetical protein